MAKSIVSTVRALVILSAILSGWRLAAQGVVVFSGWDYKTKKPNWDIYSLPLNGSPKTLAGASSNEVYAFAFPGGEAIGFLVEKPGKEANQILKLDLASGATTDLGVTIKAATRCQVSPDLKQLACDDHYGQNSQIVIFDLDTKEKQKITEFRNDCQDPSWSPDGKNLVYWIGGNADQVGKDAKPKGNHLAIYNLASREHHLLTKEPGGYDAYAQWSPDGQWIAFHRKGNSRGEWNIWMIRPDGTEATQLTTGRLESTYPSWSPDSKQIAYQCYRPKPDAYDICGVEVAGKRVFSITETDKVDERQPIWIK
jgi:Tol biopolymer transport system component